MKNSIWDHIRNKQNISAACVCLLGVGLNLLLGYLAATIGLPIYLDTVGTVIVAILGGYLPGVAVGFVTNVIKSFSDPSSLYYGVLNAMIAIAAAYLARRGFFKKWVRSLVSIPVFTLIGGGIGALIPWYMEELVFDSESLSGILYQTGMFDQFFSHLLSSLIIDLLDKAVTVLLVVIILNLLPKQLNRYSSFIMWMQTPLDNDGAGKKEERNVRTASLRTKLLFVLIFSLFTVAFVGTFIGVRVYYKTIIRENERLATGAATLASKVIDGNDVEEYLTRGEKAKGYAKTKDLLSDILFSSPQLAYLYVYKMTEDGFVVVFDIDTEDEEAGEIGSLIPYDDGFTPFIPQLLNGEEVEPIITNDEYGYLLTAAAPVYDSDGKCACYAIADVDVENIIADRNSFLVEIITVYLSFFILLCAFVMWLVDFHVIYPIKTITDTVDGFTLAGASQDKLDEDVKIIRSIDVHTGDELEKLYQSVCSMTKNQSEQMRSIHRLSDSTLKMQDGLIITMADMVENRDSDTGAHVQKTAAYVKIIAEGLKKKGYYAEKLTPKFMSDAVRSAPLHDVGKINIPDEVLNKPGKLTDEEYEIMKTHTTAGKRIMEHAISSVEGDNYLKEARNMAAYHHERWDGKGYPEGLHGEVIPLSARIMAVADVFDALTSPRIYKPAFPLEKALSILEEGKGTQFDPKCIEVFMESMDEVKVVMRKYNPESL